MHESKLLADFKIVSSPEWISIVEGTLRYKLLVWCPNAVHGYVFLLTMTKKLQLQIFCPMWLRIQQLVPLFCISWKMDSLKAEHWGCSVYVWIEVTAKLLFEWENKKVFWKIVQIVQSTKIRHCTWHVSLETILLAVFQADTSSVLCH